MHIVAFIWPSLNHVSWLVFLYVALIAATANFVLECKKHIKSLLCNKIKIFSRNTWFCKNESSGLPKGFVPLPGDLDSSWFLADIFWIWAATTESSLWILIETSEMVDKWRGLIENWSDGDKIRKSISESSCSFSAQMSGWSTVQFSFGPSCGHWLRRDARKKVLGPVAKLDEEAGLPFGDNSFVWWHCLSKLSLTTRLRRLLWFPLSGSLLGISLLKQGDTVSDKPDTSW